MSVLNETHFHNEAAAYRFVEKRVWPTGPVCPHCGGFEKIGKLAGESTRPGVYKCYQCRKPFTVKVGTVFESSHVKLHVWLQAMFLIASSKKGISSNQLHRTLGVTLKTAWFMSHRLRLAMATVGIEPRDGDGHTFCNFLPLPLGHCCNNSEEQSPSRRGSIDTFRERNEVCVLFAKVIGEVEEFASVACQSSQF